ncbi:beta-ketoacyl-[acyl-carrier-protein] synthase family protein [Streptomyces liangshanensis]|uniref:Beta-ketoacyl-[acyl-carrier-protein] synthase family protein n=1 Tax=Streptomyces liangshanensis TaxID=2717324 RepID=A0A6G9GZ96_9ACTN|nr:beta-ketoacyl-[acyl-carrier-protein] synthase family protein [Streptomyces liangshanensis]QIQ03386.1 beta-ketoacyl-[acyl-carrier-protein] synthase family protein [Streptomyces liangshanensis]
MTGHAATRRTEPLAVTGIGLVTPAGLGTRATWDRVCAGVPTAAADPELAGLPVPFSCRVPGFDPRVHVGVRQAWRLDRATQFAITAAREAVADAGLDPLSWDGRRVAVVMGSAAGGVTTYESQHSRLLRTGPRSVSPLTLPAFLPNMAAGQTAIALDARGPALHTSTACASGATALIVAAMLLREGACDIAVAGGTDAMVTPLCVTAFSQMGALSGRAAEPAAASRPFDADRDGFVIAEGAGVLVLERAGQAAARRAPVHALFVGHGSTTDAHDPVAPHPEGRGLREAFLRALATAGAGPADVDHINAHGTSTPLNDAREAGVLRRLFGARPPTVTSTKGVIGHPMGAAGSIEAALTALTVSHQLAPPTANFRRPDSGTGGLDLVTGGVHKHPVRLALSASAGFGGHNTVLAFRPPESSIPVPF